MGYLTVRNFAKLCDRYERILYYVYGAMPCIIVFLMLRLTAYACLLRIYVLVLYNVNGKRIHTNTPIYKHTRCSRKTHPTIYNIHIYIQIVKKCSYIRKNNGIYYTWLAWHNFKRKHYYDLLAKAW